MLEMEITLDQKKQIETLSKTFADTIFKFVINPNDVFIGNNLPLEKVKETFDKIFANQQFTDFLKEHHKEYNLINVMGNGDIFIKYICDKLKNDIDAPLTDQEEKDLISSIKTYFNGRIIPELISDEDVKNHVQSNYDIEDVYNENDIDNFIKDQIINKEIGDLFNEQEIKDYLRNSDIDFTDIISKDDVKGWIENEKNLDPFEFFEEDTIMDAIESNDIDVSQFINDESVKEYVANSDSLKPEDLFDDEYIKEMVSDYHINSLDSEVKSKMLDQLITDENILSNMTKEDKMNILKTIIETL